MDIIAFKLFNNPDIKLQQLINDNDIITHDMLCDSLEQIVNNSNIINNIRNDNFFKENLVKTFELVWIESLKKESYINIQDKKSFDDLRDWIIIENQCSKLILDLK